MQRSRLTAENIQSVAARAALIIASEGVVIHPTDTVYGLACDATHPGAVARVMRMKHRPQGVPFIVLVEDLTAVEPWIDALDDVRREIVARCQAAGAITFVMRSSALARTHIVGCGETLAFRVPDDLFCVALCRFAALPVLSTSANIHGSPVPLTIDAADAELCEQSDLVVDGGVRAGVPSTIVDLTGSSVKVLREGGVRRDDLRTRLSPEFLLD